MATVGIIRNDRMILEFATLVKVKRCRYCQHRVLSHCTQCKGGKCCECCECCK